MATHSVDCNRHWTKLDTVAYWEDCTCGLDKMREAITKLRHARAWAALWKLAAKEWREEAYEQKVVKDNYARSLATTIRNLDELHKMYSALTDERDELRQQVAQLRGLVKDVWIDDGEHTQCPWCGGPYPNHFDDCEQQAALAATEEGE